MDIMGNFRSLLNRSENINGVIKALSLSVTTYFLIDFLEKRIDPVHNIKKQAKTKAYDRFARLGLEQVQIDKLTDYEVTIAAHLVVPDEISVSWNDIAGLDNIRKEIQETLFLSIKYKHLFSNNYRLIQPPKGVLLHGPPGVGKTLIAKATAKEAKMNFINVDLSTLTDKLYGESQKIIAAVFSLATKLQPCFIFIDEIDLFLGYRDQRDLGATAMMKAQFMALWDGLTTDPDCTVIVMGATNRPQDLDKAIQRRMSATFRINLPDVSQRDDIFKMILRIEPTTSDVDTRCIAEQTDSFSGSDIFELCRNASVYRVKDYMSQQNSHAPLQAGGATTSTNADSEDNIIVAIRPITTEDLNLSLKKFKDSHMFNEHKITSHNPIDLA